MNSEHIDAVASAMWEVALASTNGMGDVLWRAAAYSTNLSELKLRTLARMNVLPAWWLFREYAVEKFRSDINWTVDDSAKEMFWKMCLDDTMKHTYARDQLLVKAEQRKAEYAMKQEQEQGDIKAE